MYPLLKISIILLRKLIIKSKIIYSRKTCQNIIL